MPRSARVSRSKLPLLFWLGIVVCAALAYLVGRYALDWTYYERGVAARQRLDCPSAIQAFDQILTGWRIPELDDFSRQAAVERAECAAYQQAVDRQAAGQWQDAAAGYDTFLAQYPGSPLVPLARSRLENTAFLSAVNLEEQSLYDEALQAYEDFIFRFPTSQQAADARQRLTTLAYQEAVEHEKEGKLAEALLGYHSFMKTYPNHAMAGDARQRISSLLLTGSPDDLASQPVCEQMEVLIGDAGLGSDSPVIPGLYLACGVMYEREAQPHSAFDMFAAALVKGPESASARVALELLSRNSFACENALALSGNPLFTGRGDFLSDLYINCAGQLADAGDPEGALRLYDRFLADYPDDPRAGEVQQAAAQAMIDRARDAGAGEIAAPNQVAANESEVTRVVIQNDSPEQLRLVFTGPDTLLATLVACESCPSFTGAAPSACPEQGPTGTYDLPAGTYDVLVESVSSEGVTPFVGSWKLEGGEYYTCFFVLEEAQ